MTDSTGHRDGKERRFSIDALRTFALCTIIFSHAMATVWPTQRIVYMEMVIASASLFFMTSGAFIFPVRPSAGAFLRRRFASYLPQFVVWSIAYLFIIRHVEGDGYSIGQHLRWILFTPTWSSGWFMYAITGLYLIAPVLSPWLTRASRRTVEVFLGIWLLSGFIPFVSGAAPNLRVEPIEGIFGPFYGFVGYMVAGYYLTRWLPAKRTARGRLTLFGVLVAILVLGAFFLRTAARWGFDDYMHYDLSFNVMAVNMLIFALFTYIPQVPADSGRRSVLGAVVRVTSGAVTWVSRHSLSIYLWHSAVILLVVVPAGLPAWLIFPTALAVSIAGAALTDPLFKFITTQTTNHL